MTVYRRTRTVGARDGGEWAFRGALRAVAVDRQGRWFLVGDQEVKVFTAANEPVRRWRTGRPGWSAAVDPEGRVWVGEEGQIEIFSADGRLVSTWRDKLFRLVTAMSISSSEVLVADAGSRWIHRFDREHRLLNHVGEQHRKGGFHIPSGVLDFGQDEDGTIVVANPGMHRVERYTPSGELLGHFGRFGQQDPASFPGCCNPTNLALGPAGEVVVSEKAGPRVKVYDRDGTLLAVVAEGSEFDPACANMDLAVDGDGAIGVVDTVGLRVVIFEPVGMSGTKTTGGAV